MAIVLTESSQTAPGRATLIQDRHLCLSTERGNLAAIITSTRSHPMEKPSSSKAEAFAGGLTVILLAFLPILSLNVALWLVTTPPTLINGGSRGPQRIVGY